LDLDFSAEQEMLRRTVRGVCESYCSLRAVRQLEDDPVGYPAQMWKQLGQLDLIGLLLPEEHGGGGMGALEGVVLYEELGRALAPVPHLVSAVLGGGAIALAGTKEQQREWLPGIASGESIVVPAWFEPENSCAPEGVQLRAELDGGGYKLTGTKRHVGFASSADRLLVLARTGERPGEIGMFLVDPRSEGAHLSQQLSIGSDCQYEVHLKDVRVAGGDLLGGESAGWPVWERVVRDACILLGAQAVGGARYALDITVQYAKDRRQFDKPLGAFQAISHYLADASTALDGATMLVYEAAWARSEGRDRDTERLAPMAKLFACKSFRDITAMAQQVFGGVGFTLEFDIQMYFRRAKQLQLSWWDEGYLEEKVAAAVLGPPSPGA
jgi:alkylation response protein AidB-like acyl-CoA dehydrogenase